MKSVIAVVIISIIVVVLIFGIASYVSNLDTETVPAGQTEKRGRAKYLIDSRWPLFQKQP